MERKCARCGELKLITEFSRDKSKPLGRSYYCRPCVREKGKINYHTNRERISEGNKMRYERSKERLREYNREYQRKHRGIENNRKIHYDFSNAVRAGKIERQTYCDACLNEGKMQAHHPDYSKPFDVQWLCHECHRKAHRTF